jgi:hypothetical protein
VKRPIVGSATRLTDGRREKDDFYRTPPRATLALLTKERFSPTIWEPACGDGAISRVLEQAGYQVISTDLVDRGFGQSRCDFLLERELIAPAVVTNPPFKLSDEFVLHALHLGAEKVAIFQRTAFLEGAARYKMLWSRFPPARVWIFSSRVTLWRGDDPDQRDTGGVMSLAWFVWERGHQGAFSGGWLP